MQIQNAATGAGARERNRQPGQRGRNVNGRWWNQNVEQRTARQQEPAAGTTTNNNNRGRWGGAAAAGTNNGPGPTTGTGGTGPWRARAARTWWARGRQQQQQQERAGTAGAGGATVGIATKRVTCNCRKEQRGSRNRQTQNVRANERQRARWSSRWWWWTTAESNVQPPGTANAARNKRAARANVQAAANARATVRMRCASRAHVGSCRVSAKRAHAVCVCSSPCRVKCVKTMSCATPAAANKRRAAKRATRNANA